jgi:hypothetical protein
VGWWVIVQLIDLIVCRFTNRRWLTVVIVCWICYFANVSWSLVHDEKSKLLLVALFC